MSLFIVTLLAVAVLGIRWWTADHPKAAGDGRPVLVLGVLAGAVGLLALWLDRRERRAH